MKTISKKREHLFILAISTILIIAITVIIFNFRENYLRTNRDRLIIMCYQTNISGSDGEQWSKELKTQFNHVPDFEVSVYETQSVGNDAMTITTEKGWAHIVTRLGAGEGDILFVDNKVFYEVLLKQNYIQPLNGNYSKPIKGDDGLVYGVDITGLTVNGLLNYGTSEYVGKGQPLPINPINRIQYEHNGLKYPARVIAVIYKGSTRIEESQNILNSLFGEGDYE